MHNSVGKLSRRKLLKAGAALGLSALPAAGGLPLFNVRRSFAQDAADPAEVLNKINVGNYVKKEYRDLYKLGDDDLLWDPEEGLDPHRRLGAVRKRVRRQDGEVRHRRGRCGIRRPTA